MNCQRVIVCQGRSCRKYDANKIFENFKQKLPSNVELISVPCLGQCGNGPMVLIESTVPCPEKEERVPRSEQIWYSEVHPDEVETVVQQHIINKLPVKAMLYPKFHSH